MLVGMSRGHPCGGTGEACTGPGPGLTLRGRVDGLTYVLAGVDEIAGTVASSIAYSSFFYLFPFQQG